jgi:predicted nuclease with RNAse H fold
MAAKGTVVGVDVGGNKKGFHAVPLRDGIFEKPIKCSDTANVVEWCLEQNADIVAVDAPCGWSRPGGSSRQAERHLKLAERKIHCFATPTEGTAGAHKGGFYDWVFNGHRLYTQLRSSGYHIYDGKVTQGKIYFETFPHAIFCYLHGEVRPAKPKLSNRCGLLRDPKYGLSQIPNQIDFVDAALCAVAAEAFCKGRTWALGGPEEGLIVIPNACDVYSPIANS